MLFFKPPLPLHLSTHQICEFAQHFHYPINPKIKKLQTTTAKLFAASEILINIAPSSYENDFCLFWIQPQGISVTFQSIKSEVLERTIITSFN